ncbi:MAG: dephospho-CoA kinase [Bacteroidaceae bacterium]|nr:dephospho-CoA kinase [Bacteroidaceae bacterium]
MKSEQYHLEEKKPLQANDPVALYGHTVFTPAQIEVLNAVAHLRTDEEVRGLKVAISNYFAQLVDKEMDRLWEEGVWNEQTLEDLKTAHYRTPYKPQQ